jgi:hypothetical protein
MALPVFEIDKGLDAEQYKAMKVTAGGSGVDPNLLRLLAKRRRKQGLAGTVTEPGQRPPEGGAGTVMGKSGPIDPRLRAAMLLRKKLRERVAQAKAPEGEKGR